MMGTFLDEISCPIRCFPAFSKKEDNSSMRVLSEGDYLEMVAVLFAEVPKLMSFPFNEFKVIISRSVAMFCLEFTKVTFESAS